MKLIPIPGTEALASHAHVSPRGKTFDQMIDWDPPVSLNIVTGC